MTMKMEPTSVHPPLYESSVLPRADIDDSVVAYAREKMLHAARAAPRRILFGRLKLPPEPHRSVERPAILEVMLDSTNERSRAHVAARRSTPHPNRSRSTNVLGAGRPLAAARHVVIDPMS